MFKGNLFSLKFSIDFLFLFVPFIFHFESYGFGLIVFKENNVFSQFDIIWFQNAFCAKDLPIIAANVSDGAVLMDATKEWLILQRFLGQLKQFLIALPQFEALVTNEALNLTQHILA